MFTATTASRDPDAKGRRRASARARGSGQAASMVGDASIPTIRTGNERDAAASAPSPQPMSATRRAPARSSMPAMRE
jgi:hypothetical protein